MDALNPFNSKLMTLDPKRRFVNLFGEFSPLCGSATILQYSMNLCKLPKDPWLHSLTIKDTRSCWMFEGLQLWPLIFLACYGQSSWCDIFHEWITLPCICVWIRILAWLIFFCLQSQEGKDYLKYYVTRIRRMIQ